MNISWLGKLPAKSKPERSEFQLDDVSFGKEIGEGTVGRVYKGIFCGEPVAIKQMKKTNAYSEATLLRECRFLKRLGNHRNIVAFKGCLMEERSLVFELCKVDIESEKVHNLKSILDVMANIANGQHPLQPKLSFIKEIAPGIQFIHAQDIVHCDLKPQNVLVTGTGDDIICKLTDFGSYYDMRVHYSMVSTTTSEIKGTTP